MAKTRTFDVYLDESGTHGSSPHLIMGGMVSSQGKWAYFNKLWGKMLNCRGIRYFHTKQLKDTDGDFSGWDKQRKEGLINDAGRIQQSATMFCISTMLRRVDYLEHYNNAEKPKKLQLDTMYGLCFRYCVLFIIDLLRRTFGSDIAINFILEAGAKNAGDAERIFYQLKKEDGYKNILKSISFDGKDGHYGLQGADFVSHTTFLAEQGEPDLTAFPAQGNLDDSRKILKHRSPAFRCQIEADYLKDTKRKILDYDAKRIAFGQRKRAAPAQDRTS
jgi:hypothetical protein